MINIKKECFGKYLLLTRSDLKFDEKSVNIADVSLDSFINDNNPNLIKEIEDASYVVYTDGYNTKYVKQDLHNLVFNF